MTGKDDAKRSQYAYLDQMSTDALKELLAAQASSETVDDSLYYLLEVIEKRERESAPETSVDVDRAWADFQEHYNTPEGDGRALYSDAEDLPTVENTSFHTKHHHPFRRTALIAAAVACIVALMIPSAFGVNLFRIMGQWTQDLFSFVDTTTRPGTSEEDPVSQVITDNDGKYASLQDALDAHNVSAPLAPTWMPEGYICDSVSVTEFVTSVDYYAFYKKDNISISFVITQYEDIADITDTLSGYERDQASVNPYITYEIMHYIFENNGQTVAVWCNDVYECFISGDITVDEMKQMVDSIYER